MAIVKEWSKHIISSDLESEDRPVIYAEYRVDSQEELDRMNQLERESDWVINPYYSVKKLPEGSYERDENGICIEYFLMTREAKENFLYMAEYELFAGEVLPEDQRYVSVYSRDQKELVEAARKINRTADWKLYVWVEKDWIGDGELTPVHGDVILTKSAVDLKKYFDYKKETSHK